MAQHFSRNFIRAIVAAALALSLSTNIGFAGEGGEGGGREDINQVNNGANNGVNRGGRVDAKAAPKRGRFGPKKWVMKDRNGKTLYTIEKSRISKKYTVAKFGKNWRNGKNKAVAVKSLSQKKMEKASEFANGKTTIRIKLDGKERTITVRGNVTG